MTLSLKQHEEERLRQEELHKYQILDSEPEKCFDDLADLAKYICNCPVALISFVDYDKDRIFFKARKGLEVIGIPLGSRKESLCAQAISQEGPVMVINDTLADERFSNSPIVVDSPNIRFYAGSPLVTPKGFKLGNLCVVDQQPNELNDAQVLALSQLAAQVVSQLELRLNVMLLKRKTENLERVNYEKNRFIGIVSHDIRQPLQNIMICSELMLQDESFEIPDQYQDHLQTTHSSAKLMHNMVDELLQLVQLDFGNIPITIEPRFTDIVPLVNRIVMNNALFAAKKDITLTMGIITAQATKCSISHRKSTYFDTSTISYREWEKEFKAFPITCFVDPSKLEQALNNLITNAVKFSHSNTNIKIDVGRKESQIFIRVTDQGLGIPSDELPMLFEPFKKLSVKPTAGESSTGLGLSIVKSIISAHSGDVQVESKENVGTTFTLLLPHPSLIPQQVVQETITHKKDRMTILVADDNTVIQKLVASVFRKRQHRVIVCGDGHEALQAFENEKENIDVLILDEEMPRMLGSEVISMIRKKEQSLGTLRTPIISCSGYTDHNHLNLLKECGADVVCSKPFEIERLIMLVENVGKQNSVQKLGC